MPTIETQVAGVTFDDRQSTIRSLRPDQPIRLERDPANKFDRNAIRVLTTSNRMIGFIPKDLAARFALALDTLGGTLDASVISTSSVSGRRSTLAVRIRFDLPD